MTRAQVFLCNAVAAAHPSGSFAAIASKTVARLAVQSIYIIRNKLDARVIKKEILEIEILIL